jgi:hypothetical protein
MSRVNGKYGDGLGRDTRWKLERIRQSRPDLLQRYERGEISLHRAACECGLVEDRFSVGHDPVKAALTLSQKLSLEEIDDLLLELSRLQCGKYRLSLLEYLDELRAEVVDRAHTTPGSAVTPKPAA